MLLMLAGSFGIAWNNGGPASLIWGWVIVCFMTMFVGIAMAEVVSSLPSSGGPYFWCARFLLATLHALSGPLRALLHVLMPSCRPAACS